MAFIPQASREHVMDAPAPRATHGLRSVSDSSEAVRAMALTLFDNDCYILELTTDWKDENEPPLKTIIQLSQQGFEMLTATLSEANRNMGSYPVDV